MSRRPKQTYHCKPLDELARQLMFSPPDKRTQQVTRLERLHDQIDPDTNYPLDFLFYRITGYRREGKESVVLAGDAVLPDLRLMIDALSRSVRIPIDESDPAETVVALAKRLGVSTKTISRWRKTGLRWRWVAPADGGRKVLIIPRSVSDRYVREHADRVERASAFTQIDPATRKRIIERARQIARRREVSLNQVAAHLAAKTGRGLETIRQILANHDRDNPQRAIFTDHTGPLNHKQKRIIVRAYRMGVPVEKIAERFKRTRSTIYRTLHQHGAGKAGRITLGYVASPTFTRPDAGEVILGRPLDSLITHTGYTDVKRDDLPAEVRPLFRQPALPQDQLRALFIRYNYLKHKAVTTRDAFDKYHPGARQVEVFNDCISQARELRDLLVRVHLPAVLSVARRHMIGEAAAGSAGMARLIELIELGLGVLIQSVETFNPTRQRFDSVLTNRLMARFATAEPPQTGQAHKRLSGEEVLARLKEVAGEAGVVISDL